MAVAGACLLLGLARRTVGPYTILVLVLAGSAHAIGEILHVTGSWIAGFDLASEQAQGQYQGFFATGVAASQMAGPVLITAVVLVHGLAGWVIAAGFFVAVGTVMLPVIAWGRCSRPWPERA